MCSESEDDERQLNRLEARKTLGVSGCGPENLQPCNYQYYTSNQCSTMPASTSHFIRHLTFLQGPLQFRLSGLDSFGDKALLKQLTMLANARSRSVRSHAGQALAQKRARALRRIVATQPCSGSVCQSAARGRRCPPLPAEAAPGEDGRDNRPGHNCELGGRVIAHELWPLTTGAEVASTTATEESPCAEPESARAVVRDLA